MSFNLPYYKAMLKAKSSTPYDYYKGLEQALINAQWTNTTTLYTVQEQTAIGTWTFTELEVRLNHMIAESTMSRKNGDDFRSINFQDIDHTIQKGLYYSFSNNYWLTTFTDEVHLLTKNIVVRRCNNWLKWKNLTTNTTYEYPCVLAYDESASENQKVKSIITPNNSVVVIVQGNTDTTSIYVNQRFIFGGRAYKIAGYNNYMMDSNSGTQPTLLYFDTYLDELSPYDDLVNNIADNSQPDNTIGETNGSDQIAPSGVASILVSPNLTALTQGQSATLTAKVVDSSGATTTDTVVCTPTGANMKNYTLTNPSNNEFVLTNTHYDPNDLILTFSSGSLTNIMSIQLKGLF
jgi:hypothetical protein